MEEKQVSDVDDVDRESLVKEIELIRQTLGGASTRAHSDGGFVSFGDRETQNDSDDSEDELAIIKSPDYRERSDETYRAQHVPYEVISSESEDEVLESTGKKHTQPTDVFSDSDGNATYQISAIVPLDNSENEYRYEVFLKPVSNKSLITNGDTQGTQSASSPKQLHSAFDKTSDSDDHTEFRQFPQDTFQSSFDTTDQNAEVVDDEEEVLLNDEEDSEELSEQQRFLKLNRKYQAIIEVQLRNIEKLITENKEQQFHLSQMSFSSSASQDKIENTRQLASYVNPYFRVARKECPDDNEDTKIRKSLGQPHPFEKPPRAWTQEEKTILSEAVKSEILQMKLTPLLQRIEAISPKDRKTKEEEKELQELRNEIDRIKILPLLTLVQNVPEPVDFEDISNKMLPSRTSHQCEVFWCNELHPLLNKEKWTKEEDKLLLKLAEENNTGGNWSEIACELKSNRSAAQCLQRYQKSLNKNFLKSKWDPEDDEKLVEAVKICGVGPWEKVSSLLDGRTGSQCMHRYNKSLDPEIKKGKWDEEEDDLVRKGVELYGTNWVKFKTLLPRRTDAQIRERWQDVLDPKLRKDAWTKEEDVRLLEVVEKQSVGLRNWATIARHMPGRTDNRCRRRWFILTKNDPKTKEHLSKQKIKKDRLVSNFSRRRADKPDIGPEDFDLPDLSETEENVPDTADDGNAGEDGAPTTPADTKTTETDQSSIPKSSKRKTSRKKRVRISKYGGTPKRKKLFTTPSSKSPKTSDVSSPEKPQTKKNLRTKSKRKKARTDKDLLPTPTTPSKATKVPSTSSKKAPTEPRTKMLKPKLTAPSPTIVSQASSLPNAMPISLLQQFSVLLQAFHIDVTGVLNTQRGGTTSQPNSSATAVSTSASQQKPVTTITETPSQTPTTGNENLSSQVFSSGGNMRSNNSNDFNPTTKNMTDTPAGTAEGNNNEVSIPQVQKVVISDGDDVGHNDATELSQSPRTEKTSKVSNGNANTLSKLRASIATDKDSQNRCASLKRKRESTKAEDLIPEKKLNGEDSRDGVERTGEDLKGRTNGVVLSDTRHGLNHDIVLSNSVSHQGQHGVRMDANKTPRRASKRKQDGSKIKTRGRKRLNQSGGEGNMNGDMSSGDIAQIETSSTRYLKRSKNGQRNVDVSEPISSSREKNNSISPDSASNNVIGNNPYLQVKRVIIDSDVRLPRVPAIPLLPPSSTTLSAFKKILILRKDLQSQANRLNVTNHTANQAADQLDKQTSNPQNASTTNSPQNPLADRLLLVSSTKQVSHEFRNSIAYQQLLNRFKGLFTWPGFLSIVNPSFKNNGVPNETAQTPKNKRRRRTR